MVYQHRHTWESQQEIDDFAAMIDDEFGTKAGDHVRQSNRVGDTISYVGLSEQIGGGLTRWKQYGHGHIGVFKKFCKQNNIQVPTAMFVLHSTQRAYFRLCCLPATFTSPLPVACGSKKALMRRSSR